MTARERPILFNGAMVRAILEGRKTQTRRIVKLPHENPLGQWEPSTIGGPGLYDREGRQALQQECLWHTRTGDTLVCPQGVPGDRLWVRETWCDLGPNGVSYRADGPLGSSRGCVVSDPMCKGAAECECCWRPSIHMPRWACRLRLLITGVRVERLQDISADDAEAEGSQDFWGKKSPWPGVCAPVAVHGFASLWEVVNGPGSWAANPWVWVVEFERT